VCVENLYIYVYIYIRGALYIYIYAHLLLCVAEDDSLRDGERVVEVAERVELPLLALHSHEKLLDAWNAAGRWR